MHFMFHHFDEANDYAMKAREICLELRKKEKIHIGLKLRKRKHP